MSALDKIGIQEIEPSIEIASLIAMSYIRLGGRLSISSDAKRYYGRAERCAQPETPQLPDTMPHEEFRSHEEWVGAMKFLEFWMRRLDNSDRDFIFDAFASVAV